MAESRTPERDARHEPTVHQRAHVDVSQSDDPIERQLAIDHPETLPKGAQHGDAESGAGARGSR